MNNLGKRSGFAAVAAVLAATTLAACGGGGSSSGGGDAPGGGAATSTGVFLDAEVGGVGYRATPSGLSGLTNAAGEFDYRAGDTVEFFVGGIVLGSAPASGVLTPAALAANASPGAGVTAEDIALNIAVFLQSFDSDNNPDNGITIDDDVATAATDTVFDFNQPTNDFVDTQLAPFAEDQGVAVVTPDDAQAHSNRTVERYLSGSWRLANDPGSEIAVLTFLTGGRYALGIFHVDPDCGNGLEFGSYQVDAATMRLAVTEALLDTTGNAEAPSDCGLYEDGEGENPTITMVNPTRMILSFEDEDETFDLTLNKVVTDGFSGSWGRPGDGLLHLLDDGRYLQVQLAGDEISDRGVETGTWSVNGAGELSATPGQDANGSSGLSDAEDITLSIDDLGRLVLSVPDEQDYVFGMLPFRIDMAGRAANSVITSSGCPGAEAGWAYQFGADAMTWTGSDTFQTDGDSCVVGEEEVLEVSYTERDAPFSCGDSVCDFFDLNKVVKGVDVDQRPFTSTYQHTPGSGVFLYTKEITGGDDAGQVFAETITLE